MMTETSPAAALKPQNPGLKFRKILGRTYLHEDRLKDAVEIFLGILRDVPDDVDTLLELGNLYLASGNGRTAASLFRRVLELAPERTIIQKQVYLADNNDDDMLPEEPVPTDPAAIARLLQRLTGKAEPIPDDEILRAYEMLQLIMSSPNPGSEVAKNLDEIGNLLPALIELNIRQARADGLDTVADALQNVQINIALQKSTQDTEQLREKKQAQKPANPIVRKRFKGNVTLLVPDKERITDRVEYISSLLQQNGCKVNLTDTQPAEDAPHPDVALFSNPHLKPALAQYMAAYSARGIPVMLDLDMDFENIPVFHPEYGEKGLGRMNSSKAYTASLVMANRITVPSQHMAAPLSAAGYPVTVIPDGWNRKSLQQQKSAPVRSDVYIGWYGQSRLVEDLAVIRRMLIRVLHEFENTKIVIIGNAQAYQLLDSVPQNRKIFLPCTSQSGNYSLLNQLNILVAPLCTHPHNDSLSDGILVEAAARSIPWIASAIPAFTEWGKGGLIAKERDEWHTYLRQLVMDADLRVSLGAEGAKAAAGREAKEMGNVWLSAVEQTLGMEISAPSS